MLALTRREKTWAIAGAGSLVAAGALAYALWPTDPRQRVVDAARSQLGSTDAAKYWADVLPPGTPPSDYPVDWCGAFALWCLHQAGLLKDVDWTVGIGFLAENLPTTKDPRPGDIAYFTNNQHHAIVDAVLPTENLVFLINGNGVGGAVTASGTAINNAAAYFSIEDAVTAAGSSSVPWMAASAALAGAAAWYLLPSR